MLKKWVFLISFCLIFSAFALLFFFTTYRDQESKKEYRISSQDLSKMLSFTNYDMEEWEEILKENKIAQNGLRFSELDRLCQLLNIAQFIQYEKNKEEEFVGMDEWFLIYRQIRSILDSSKEIKEKSCIILKQQSSDEYLTTEGVLRLGIPSYPLKEMTKYQMYLSDGEMICCRQEKKLLLSNVWIEHSEKKEKSLTLNIRNMFLTWKGADLEFYPENVLADLLFENGELKKIYCKESVISGKLNSISDQTITLEEKGEFPLSGNFTYIDRMGKESRFLEKEQLQVGEVYDFVFDKGKVCGCILKKKEDVIRVLLSDKEGHYEMKKVRITSDSEFKVIQGNETKSFHGGEIFSVESVLRGETVLVKSYDIENPLYVEGLKENPERIPYYGELRIFQGDEGVYLTCTVGIETYIKGVLPGEMPPGFEIEALKAQAICARSYAYSKIKYPVYEEYHADVDDTTNCQVYNMTPQYDSTNQAVSETEGMVLKYDNQYLEACYFSTSCGRTTDADIWSYHTESRLPYLRSVSVAKKQKEVNLSKEKAFFDFISSDRTQDYESTEKWYRWRAELDFTKNTKQISDAIMEQLAMESEYVKISGDLKNHKGESLPQSLTFLGIEVDQRSEGGNVLAIRIKTKELGDLTVTSESMIRKILFNAMSVIYDHNGERAETESKLPSSFFAIADCSYVKKKKCLEKVLLFGGGHGHGAGMSQMGANHLAADGKKAEEILNFFYKNIVIEKVTVQP